MEKFHNRAKLLAEDGKAYLREPVHFPKTDLELFFDLEADPLGNICYLHGFIERRSGDNTSERFIHFFADEPGELGEKQAFADAWLYLQDCQPCTIFYYSKYERTIYRKLGEKYPDDCTEEEIEALFSPERAIDLYSDVVLKVTEWPTRDFSIKTLADCLGFEWRDTHPSGAASVEWFHRWIETGDPLIRQRILEYNEDDCRAIRVLRDAITNLPVIS